MKASNSRRATQSLAQMPNDLTPQSDTEIRDVKADLRNVPESPRNFLDGLQDAPSIATETPIRSTPCSERTMKDSLEAIGEEPKVLLKAISELERFGVDTTIPLPRIVVVGDQSAGKSSLIEAISEIKVPRDSGTCTRCPLQITIRNNESPNSRWTCHVSLVKKFTYDPASDASEKLFPWIENAESTTTSFETVYNKHSLESAIRLAQTATLNPQMPLTSFIGASYQNFTNFVPFSPNIVALEIVAANVPNLAFFDLPGVISQDRDGRKDTINLVAELVRQYVSQENTLILLTVPFEYDIDNSKASEILNDAGANDRTIGVLTKPDRLQRDDRLETWKEVLSNKAFVKGHGYFVVKQTTQAQLTEGISHAKARTSEQEFFASSFWTSKFPGFDDRLGTARLQQVLSQKLASLIRNSLPFIAEQVHVRLVKINTELQRLPGPPANALNVVSKALSDFNRRFCTMIAGHEPNELSRSWKDMKKLFFDDLIMNQRPKLIVVDHLARITADSTFATPTHTKIKRATATATPTKREIDDAIVLDDSETDMPVRIPSKKRKVAAAAPVTPRRQAPLPTDRISLKKRFQLNEIRQTLDEFSSSGLPDVIEPKAVNNLILSTLINWHVPLGQLLYALRKAMGIAVLKTLDETTAEWRTTPLSNELKTITSRFLDLHVENLESNIALRALRIERVKPITNDTEAMKRYQEEELQMFVGARFQARSEKYFDAQDEATGKATSLEERERKRRSNEAEVIRQKLGTDPFKREIEVMAQIRAYYKIASARFVDTICQAVEAELFETLKNGLLEDLEEGLHVNLPDCHEYAAKLLEEDPARAERRNLLKRQKFSLEQAAQRLTQLS